MNIEIKSLSKAYGETVIFDDFSLKLKGGMITGILGPSGSGKTTLLHIIAGLITPDSGDIEGVNRDQISLYFQEPRLLPWLTERENLRLVFPDQPVKKTGRRDEAINAMLTTVGLSDSADLYPGELSGGMRQRVSIARAFLYPSELMLMDEPFSSLDEALKNRLMDDFLEIWRLDRRTVIFVSHDREELEKLSGEIITLTDKPVKIGKP